MKKAAFALLAVALLGVTGCAHNWQDFTAPDNSFSVRMPGSPKKESKTMPFRGGTLTIDMYIVGGRDYSFAVGVATLPVRVPNMNAAFDGAAHGMALTCGGTILSRTPLTHDGKPGMEVEIKSTKPEGHITARFFFTSGRFYQVLAGGTRLRASDQEVKDFLDSFRFNP